MEIQVQGHVLGFSISSKMGDLVFDLWIGSCLAGTYRMSFDKKDLHQSYRQPMQGDRVRMMVSCGYDNQPWYIVDGSLQLICPATTVELVGS